MGKAECKISPIPLKDDPHHLVWPFINETRKHRDHSTKAFRELVTKWYYKTFQRYPTDSMVNSLIYNRVAYELQMRGYNQSSRQTPESVIQKHNYHKEVEERVMEADNATTASTGAQPEAPAPQPAEKVKAGRTLSATAYRRKLIMNNHEGKLTDDQIMSAVKEKFPDKNMTTSVQWARSDLIRNHKKYGFVVEQIHERARRFDADGKDITKFNKKRKNATPPKPVSTAAPTPPAAEPPADSTPAAGPTEAAEPPAPPSEEAAPPPTEPPPAPAPPAAAPPTTTVDKLDSAMGESA